MSAAEIYPVIHYANDAQALHNAEIVAEAGCPGLFLIDMDGRDLSLDDTARDIKKRWPALKVGINHLRMHPVDAMKMNVRANVDMTWTDKQVTHSQAQPWVNAMMMGHLSGSLHHQCFVGVDFKYQPPEPDPAKAARAALFYNLVPTTSGPATGMPADTERLARIRDGNFAGPLAIASGITPENASKFSPFVTHMLVATGISTSFYALDPVKLRALMEAVQ